MYMSIGGISSDDALKVKATMTGGTDQWSDTLNVGQNAHMAELDD